MSVGDVIVATWKPHETAVLEAIRDHALELQVIFNKDAVMVLPAGVNKASGLKHALRELDLSPHEVIGVGDAENDHAFLSICECSVAVDNALTTLKERADIVTTGDHGRGVEQLIGEVLKNDLKDFEPRLTRHHLLMGHQEGDVEVRLAPFESNLLIAGPSGSGKSTINKSFLERLRERRYQFCIIDPEGDYDGFEGAVTTGSSKHGPDLDEILQLLKKPDTNVVVNLVGLPLADRPPFFLSLLPRLQEMRGHVGRPHWIVVDEAHHLLPAAWEPGKAGLPRHIDRMAFITVHPDQVMTPVLEAVTDLIAVGSEPRGVFDSFCRAVHAALPRPGADMKAPNEGEVWYWPRRQNLAPFTMKMIAARAEHQRHVRKYAEGELPPERCFYFRGRDNKLKLKAQNLVLFNQIAEGVDDETWLFHLEQGDYSRWFREGIGDETLAEEARQLEQSGSRDAAEGRLRMRRLIESHYTLPASAPLPMPGTDSESSMS
jgi:hypothetical protein